MKQLLCILLALLGNTFAVAAVTQAELDDALDRLDKSLTRREVYIAMRQARIDSLRGNINDDKNGNLNELNYLMKIADEFSSFNNDSALYYYTIGLQHATENADDTSMLGFTLKRATYLPPGGFINKAIETYTAADTTALTPDMLELYYESGRQMYSFIASFYMDHPDISNYYNSLSLDAQYQLLTIEDPESYRYKLNSGEYYYLTGEYNKAKSILLDLFADIKPDNKVYARAAHILSDIADAQNDQNSRLYYLALSAIADIQSATLEVTSLQELGALIYDLGDIERAYKYMSTALANAVECHASMRVIQTSAVLPLIAEAHNRQVRNWERTNYIIIIALAVLLTIIIVVMIFLRRQMSKMSVMQQNLRSANHIKETYISQFMTLCSVYMDKLNQFSKMVNRKISAGQVEELYKITKSGKFVEEQSREFYEVFDNAFLHIYPTFVSDVNRLLRPDEQITLREGELLNTDLRILAFMRLGINDSNRMAQILNYSINTIYTYRNRTRNKAINRDTFEQDIMSLS